MALAVQTEKGIWISMTSPEELVNGERYRINDRLEGNFVGIGPWAKDPRGLVILLWVPWEGENSLNGYHVIIAWQDITSMVKLQ